MGKIRNRFSAKNIVMLFACMLFAIFGCSKIVSAKDYLVTYSDLSLAYGVFWGKNGVDKICKDDSVTLEISNNGKSDVEKNIIWEISGIENGQFYIFQGETIVEFPDVPTIYEKNGVYKQTVTIPKGKKLLIRTEYHQKTGTTGGADYASLLLETAPDTGTDTPGTGGGTGTDTPGTGGGTGTDTPGTGGGTGTDTPGTGGGTGTDTPGTGGGTGTVTPGTGSTGGDVVKLTAEKEFTLDKPATVTVSTSEKCGDLWYIWQIGANKNMTYGNDADTKTVKLPAGSYKIETRKAFNSATKFTVTKKDFEFGNVKVSFDSNYRTFTVEYIPAAGTLEDDAKATYIEKWNFSYGSNGRNSGFNDEKDKKFTETIPYPPSTPGWYDLKFTIRNESFNQYLTCERSVTIPQLPETPSYKAGYMTDVTWNSATFANLPSPSCGAYSVVQVYENGVWKDKTAGKAWGSAKLEGLKPNRTYRCRLRGKELCSPQNILSYPSNEFTFRTGVKDKPAIKSVKITKAKVSKTPYKPATYYYDSFGKRHDVAASGGYYVTNYKITVTLKKRVSGPKGMVINGKYVKGTGKKFSITESVKGKKIGKTIKVKVKYANSPEYGGYSPEVTKKAKIRK